MKKHKNKKNTKLKDIKAVIFDYDDTLMNSYSSVLKIFQSFAEKHNLLIPSSENLKTHWGKPIVKIVGGLWPHLHEEDYYKHYILHVKESNFRIYPLPEMINTIKALQKKDLILGVVTSTSKGAIKQHMPKLGKQIFSFIHTADDSDFHKPDPRVFDLAFEHLNKKGITEKQCVYVGDSIRDFQAAKARGMHFLAVTTGFTTKDQFMEEGLDKNLILESIEKITEYI